MITDSALGRRSETRMHHGKQLQRAPALDRKRAVNMLAPDQTTLLRVRVAIISYGGLCKPIRNSPIETAGLSTMLVLKNDRRSTRSFRSRLPLLIGFGLATAFALLFVGCSKKTAPGAPSAAATPSAPVSVSNPRDSRPEEPQKAESFETLPVTLTVKQRTTTAVPGTAGQLSLTVDDITRGQVMISLLDQDGTPLVGPVSAEHDQSISFQVGGATYAARVTELSNALVGDDFVTVVIDRVATTAHSSDPAPEAEPELKPQLTDREKIERLIVAVEVQQGAKFVRNGTTYSAQEAAEHLRMKVKHAGSRVQTVSDFIEKIATKSSITGKPYSIELADGRTLTTSDFLRSELAKIEQGTAQVSK